jgi:hypothetical protein
MAKDKADFALKQQELQIKSKEVAANLLLKTSQAQTEKVRTGAQLALDAAKTAQQDKQHKTSTVADALKHAATLEQQQKLKGGTTE